MTQTILELDTKEAGHEGCSVDDFETVESSQGTTALNSASYDNGVGSNIL